MVLTVAAGFVVIGDTVAVRVRVRIKGIHIVLIIYAVVIVVGVVVVDDAVFVKITTGKYRIRAAYIQRVALIGIDGAVLIGVFRAVDDVITVAVAVQRVSFAGVLCAVLIRVFDTVRDLVVIGVIV